MLLALPTMLFAQEKARKRVCNTQVKGVVVEYHLVATTMRRWLREERRFSICENCSEEKPAARHDVRFLYTTAVRQAHFNKKCVVVRRYLKAEWTNKNNLRSRVVGRKLKEIHSVQDAAAKVDYKILTYRRFLSKPGVVVVAERSAAPITDFKPVMDEIGKRKSEFPEEAVLIVVNRWNRKFPLKGS